jgi:A/G-specific adenine glycosylase
MIEESRIRRVRRAILQWQRGNLRPFFWRTTKLSPFAMLVIEILLSRTRAATVEPVAIRLLSCFPRPEDLAAADLNQLSEILYPLGLHRKRSRQLISCARELVNRFGGSVPRKADALVTLPYVGRYTANAVLCFSFRRKRAVIDANVARVWRRVFSLPKPPLRLSSAHHLWEFAQSVLPDRTCHQFNWAILDLGGTICLSRRPKCQLCPLVRICDAHIIGDCGCDPT